MQCLGGASHFAATYACRCTAHGSSSGVGVGSHYSHRYSCHRHGRLLTRSRYNYLRVGDGEMEPEPVAGVEGITVQRHLQGGHGLRIMV